MLARLLAGALLLTIAVAGDDDFIYNGFRGANLSLDGTAAVTPEGLLRLTNTTTVRKSYAFFPNPVRLKPANDGSAPAFSFASTFVFGIIPEFSLGSGHGIALVLSPSKGLPFALGSQYLGLFNTTNNGNPSNHVVAIELDTVQNPEFSDINNNHVGVDVDGMNSTAYHAAGYYPDDADGGFQNLTLISGEPMQAWVEYDGRDERLNVTLSPLGAAKPRRPLLSSAINLSGVVLEQMYVGFSSSSETFQSSHYILGWSFKVNGIARPLDLSILPRLPRTKKKPIPLAICLGSAAAVSVLVAAAGVAFVARRRAKFSELLEDWELAYGPHRFAYKDLFEATHGFRETELLGTGGFGGVYRGVLPCSKAEVAVKRVSHGTRQGMREFVAEVVSLGRVQHRNLVRLLGYCRRVGELLLVYDFMPHGSLDRLLFDLQPGSTTLGWSRRLGVIRGVASGLLYLHEEWEQVVLHRDVKASNVLLDGDYNGKLGDFGLARLYDHGSDPQTTHVVGTMGYLAPELTKTGKATKATDVFSFGVFLLEVACGRRPIEPGAPAEEVVLVDWVLACWSRGEVVAAADPNLGGDHAAGEMELVLKLGLLCCDPLPAARPGMRAVVQVLAGDVPLPEFSSNYLNAGVMGLLQNEAFDFSRQAFVSESATVSLLFSSS